MEKIEAGLNKKITRRKFLSDAGKALAAIAVGAIIPGTKSVHGTDRQGQLGKPLKIKGMENLKAMISPEHLEIYITKIYPIISHHLKEIHGKLGEREYELSEKNLYHVHPYFRNEDDNPLSGNKLRDRWQDITYLYHAKELMKDTTKRNIIIDNKGRFETYDGDGTDPEGREIASIYFADSLEKFEKIIEQRKDFIDKNSLTHQGNYYFAVSNMNYR